jgi:hypothetical protein
MAHVSQCEFRFNADLQAKYMGFLQGAVDPPFFIEEIIADNPPLTSSCSAYSFDAYMAITLVACSIENKDFLTNRDLLDAIRTLDFKGVTGTVRFDPVTGSRVASAQYAVSNIIRKSETESKIFFSVKVSTLVDIAVGGFQDKITVISPFVYADGTTNLPPSLPALTEKQQQVNTTCLVIGHLLVVIVMASAIGWAMFTFLHNRARYVQSAPPAFLFM